MRRLDSVCEDPAAFGQTGRQRPFIYRVLVLLAALACLVSAVVLIFLAVAPYSVVLHIARWSTGSRKPLSPEQYAVLLPRLLPGGVFYGVIGVIFLLSRRKLESWLGVVARSLQEIRAHEIRTAVKALHFESRWHLLSLALGTLIGIVLRVLYLNEPPRYDESFTYVEFAKRSLVHVFAYYPAPNNHILHTALVWISCRIFGDSLWAMRLPALLAGIAVIPLTYVTTRKLAGRGAGLLAAGLMAVSGPFVLYSVNARGYALQAALLLIMLYLASRVLENAPGRMAYWILFSMAAIAGFWIAPSMLYPYLVVAGWLFWAGGPRLLRSLFASAAVTAIAVVTLYMPVVIVSGPDALLRNPWVRPLSPEQFRAQALRFPAELVRLMHGSDPLSVAVLVVMGAALSFLFMPRTGRCWAHPVMVALPVVLILPLAQRVVPFPRVLLPLFPIYYLSAAAGWCGLANRMVRWRERPVFVAFVALIGFLGLHLTRSGYIESWREFPDGQAVARYLAGHLRPSDRLVVTVSAGCELIWELEHAGISYAQYYVPKPDPGRVLVATEYRRVPGVSGNGLIDPSQLTVEGMLRHAGVNEAAYTPPRLIFRSGRGEVFELLPRSDVAGHLLTRVVLSESRP